MLLRHRLVVLQEKSSPTFQRTCSANTRCRAVFSITRENGGCSIPVVAPPRIATPPPPSGHSSFLPGSESRTGPRDISLMSCFPCGSGICVLKMLSVFSPKIVLIVPFSSSGSTPVNSSRWYPDGAFGVTRFPATFVMISRKLYACSS